MTENAAEILRTRFVESRNAVLLSVSDGQDFTYGQIYANARALADRWRAEGLAKGDTVAFLLPNCPGYLTSYLACIIGGYVANPIVPELAETSVQFISELAKPKLLLREPPELDADLAAPSDADIRFESEDDKPFLNIFTSGTTGNPKGICHSLGGIIHNAASFARLSGMGTDTRLYHILPMAYMAGFQNTMLCPLLAGGTIVLGPVFSPASAVTFWQRPVSARANFLTLTPTIASALSRLGARNIEASRKAASLLVSVQCTAGQLTHGIRQQFLEVFGIPLQDCYGVTELGGPFTLQSREDAAIEDNVGRPLPELEISILSGTASEGELWIKTPAIMLGYLDREGLDPPLLSDGFVATGDIATFENGKLTITGRLKDMIIKGGINIAPRALENVISDLPEVEDVAVIGVDHEFWGEVIVACVTAKDSNSKSALKLAIQNHCTKNLASIHRPDMTLIVDVFPRAMNGKIQKHALRDRVLAELSAQPPA
ncbi:MAG: class I adenylate-forming enzyme family protein [Alphaproteobacteria bacterium]